MKVIKKICVFLLVGMITFSSTALSYQKANTCQAVSIGVGVGIVAAVLAVGGLCYGAYYMSQPENQANVKQALSDYASTTVECAQMQYEMNKKLFNDFCDYAISHAGSNAAVRTANGKKYTVEDLKDEGFPSFEKWDEEMKKQNKKPSKNFGSIWDKLSFGLDLLDFIRGFFDDDEGYGSGGSGGQSYFEGETYYDKETGKFSVFADTMIYKSGSWVNDVYTYDKPIMYHFSASGVVKESYRENFRLCLAYTNSVYNKLFVDGETDKENCRYYMQAGGYKFGYNGQLDSITYDCYITQNGTQNKYTPGTASYAVLIDHFLRYDEETKKYSLMPTNYLYLSSNMPVFFDKDAANAYKESGDYSGAINLPPNKTTPEPTGTTEKPSTPVSIYVNSFQNKNVTVNDITYVNYYIVNNWNTTTNKTENLTTVINNYYTNNFDGSENDNEEDEKEESTPTPRPTLTPTENESGGDTNTYNFFIEIENILSPIKVTVENIYNFFKIDTEQIGNAWQLDYVPSADFRQLVDAFDKMSAAFGDDVYVGTVVESSVNSSGNDSISVNSGIATSQQNTVYDTLLTDYPIISFKCPEILSPYITTTDSDGNKTIILCDFENYALYFARFRAFINIVLWIGLLFYLMREVKVNFVIH